MSDPPVPLWWESLGAPEAASTVVLVPDAQRPAAYWPQRLIEGLCQAGWRVVRLDLRDQGRSPWPAEPYDVADLAADVIEVCREASAGSPCHLVGHGLGGAVSLEVALHVGLHPDTALQLCGLTVTGTSGWLVDPVLPGPEEPVAVGLIWRTRMGEGQADRVVRAVARELRLGMSEDDDVGGPAATALVEHWLAWGFNPLDRHHRAWLEAPDRWADLAGLSVPLTVVHGSSDPIVPLAHGVRLATTVPGAQLLELEGGGHALGARHVDALLAAVGPGPGLQPGGALGRGRGAGARPEPGPRRGGGRLRAARPPTAGRPGP